MLEAETKRFEDLEFQQLERESRQDEEKETHTQQLLREIADYQRSSVTRKVTALPLCFQQTYTADSLCKHPLNDFEYMALSLFNSSHRSGC